MQVGQPHLQILANTPIPEHGIDGIVIHWPLPSFSWPITCCARGNATRSKYDQSSEKEVRRGYQGTTGIVSRCLAHMYLDFLI